MTAVLDFVRRKPRTSALIALGVAGLGGYALFAAENPGALLAWAPLALCVLMHGLMHGGHGHAHGEDKAGKAE